MSGMAGGVKCCDGSHPQVYPSGSLGFGPLLFPLCAFGRVEHWEVGYILPPLLRTCLRKGVGGECLGQCW